MKKRLFAVLLGLAIVGEMITPISVSANDVTGEMVDTVGSSTTNLLGDMNGDGSVELADAQIVLKMALGIIPSEDAKDSAVADVNRDNEVTLNDAQLVLKKSLNIINNFDDVLVERKFAANRTKLKNYILQYGSTNSDGNRFIKITWDTGENDFAIVYNESTNSFQFITASITTGSPAYESAIRMVMNLNGVSTVSPEYALLFTDSQVGCVASTTFNIKEYNQNSTVYFKASELVDLTESDIQELANAELKLAFAGWQLLLSELQMNMSDIGFVSYE